MVTFDLLKVAVHPTSHSCPTDSNEWGVRSGKRCAIRAVVWIWGIRNSTDPTDDMAAPLGSATSMGVAVGFVALVTSVVDRKWPVLPVSATANREGGPRDFSLVEVIWFSLILFLTTLKFLGSPPFQASSPWLIAVDASAFSFLAGRMVFSPRCR